MVIIFIFFLHKFITHVLDVIFGHDGHEDGALHFLIQFTLVELGDNLLFILPVRQDFVEVVGLIGLLRLQDTGF